MLRILRGCFPDARFRFQVPLLSYTLDFCSHRARLVVEVDGGQHGGSADATRTAAIEAEGYRVIRFWNHDLLGNADGVAIAVDVALQQVHPHPTLPHQGGGE
jgi:very-short-patch-repair endonuclease